MKNKAMFANANRVSIHRRKSLTSRSTPTAQSISTLVQKYPRALHRTGYRWRTVGDTAVGQLGLDGYGMIIAVDLTGSSCASARYYKGLQSIGAPRRHSHPRT